jgi:hypothetical protein
MGCHLKRNFILSNNDKVKIPINSNLGKEFYNFVPWLGEFTNAALVKFDLKH